LQAVAVLKAALDAGAGALHANTKDWAVPQRKADAIGLVAERALSVVHAAGPATKDVPAGTCGVAEVPGTPDGNAPAGTRDAAETPGTRDVHVPAGTSEASRTAQPPVRPIGRAER